MRRAVAGVGGGRSGGVGRFRGLCACLLVFFVCVCVCRGVEGRGFVGSRCGGGGGVVGVGWQLNRRRGGCA